MNNPQIIFYFLLFHRSLVLLSTVANYRKQQNNEIKKKKAIIFTLNYLEALKYKFKWKFRRFLKSYDENDQEVFFDTIGYFPKLAYLISPIIKMISWILRNYKSEWNVINTKNGPPLGLVKVVRIKMSPFSMWDKEDCKNGHWACRLTTTTRGQNLKLLLLLL